MKNKENFEERTEDKYILNTDEFYDEFIESIENYLKPYSPIPGTNYTINTSIYFDSPELTSLKDHLDGSKERSKVRLRTYASNGIQSNDRYIEIKRKEYGITKKDRLKIGKEAYRSLLINSTLPVNDELLILNEDMIPEADIIIKARVLNTLMTVGELKPVVQIDYKRKAYQNDETFRVTLDTDLKVTPLPDAPYDELSEKDLQKQLKKVEAKFLNSEDFILEVKKQGKEPKWMSKKLEKYVLEPTSFSKYVFSMALILGNELKVKQR